MMPADSRRVMLAVRAYLNGDRSGQNTARVARYVIAKAVGGHFGFFKLVIDLVDGKLRQSIDEEFVFEPDCLLVVTDEERQRIPHPAGFSLPSRERMAERGVSFDNYYAASASSSRSVL